MRYGFIRRPEDIKFLILHCLTFMPFAVAEEDILEMVLIDDAFGYFEFSEAFHQLIESRLVGVVKTEDQTQYIITPSGGQLILDMGKTLPPSVRDNAEKAAMRVVAKIRRNSAIFTSHIENDDGSYTVTLSVKDKVAEHLKISLSAVSERQCFIIENNFKEQAEAIFTQLIQTLSQ